MKMRHVAAISVFLVCLSVAATAQMTHEETLIRTAYSRLTYAAQLRIVAQDAMNTAGSAHGSKTELQAQITSLAPHFAIDSVAVGELSAITDQPWDRLVSKPDGDLIDVGASGVSPTFTTPNGVTKKSMFYVMTGWSNHVFEASWDGITVAKAVSESAKPPGVEYNRYASYRVQATLSGRSRSYNAMFLFGKDAKGNEAVHMVDHIVGMGSLDLVASQSLYPEVILETYYRELPEISDWIAGNTVQNQTQSRDAYCSPSGCGLPSAWVNKSLAVPIDPKTREFLPQEGKPRSNIEGEPPGSQPESANCSNYSTYPTLPPITTYNTADHKTPGIGTGEHTASFTGLGGSCQYSGTGSQPNCSTTCAAEENANPTAADLGATSSGFCHEVNWGWQDGTAAASYSGTSCTGYAGFGAARCASVCDCSVTETFTGGVYTTSTVGGTVLYSASPRCLSPALRWRTRYITPPTALATPPSSAATAIRFARTEAGAVMAPESANYLRPSTFAARGRMDTPRAGAADGTAS